MSKFLISYYPVYPAEEVNVYNLDALKFEDGTSLKGVKKKLKWNLLYTIRAGAHRVGGYVRNGIFFTYSNNSTHFIVTADGVRDALDKWRAIMTSTDFKALNRLPKEQAIRVVTELFEELGTTEDEDDLYPWQKGEPYDPNETV